MSEDEDDYLSDKFLASLESASSSGPKSYSERRKDAQKRAEKLQQTNRIKSRREREEEAREEALSKSLFERAEEEKNKGGNKALSMMMKMGFKPGQPLGQKEESVQITLNTQLDKSEEVATPGTKDSSPSPKRRGHRTEPLPLNEWTGKKGIGLGKRTLSPSEIENLAKASKFSEATDIDSFRNRTREGYQERRAEGQLRSAQRTCVTQDTAAGIGFNVYWLDPEAPDTFPRTLLNALEDDAYVLAPLVVRQRALEDVQARTRLDMQADALQPLQPLDVVNDDHASMLQAQALRSEEEFDEDTISRASSFLRLNAPQRLEAVLLYLRKTYHYCFWCGTQYANADELETSCPGEDEEDHD